MSDDNDEVEVPDPKNIIEEEVAKKGKSNYLIYFNFFRG